MIVETIAPSAEGLRDIGSIRAMLAGQPDDAVAVWRGMTRDIARDHRRFGGWRAGARVGAAHP
ncbi:MAG: hypothetical protein HC788_01240 [Sphingopyxis sp.]|nr:hypothetical protein [Sphingopyxis sp.]